MDTKYLRQVIRYYDIFPLLKDSPVRIKDFNDEFTDQDTASERNTYRYKSELLKATDCLIGHNNDSFFLDIEKIAELLHELAERTGFQIELGRNGELDLQKEQYRQNEILLQKLQPAFEQVSLELASLKEQNHKLTKSVSELQNRYTAADAELQRIRLDPPLLVLSTVEAGPKRTSLDDLFITDPIMELWNDDSERIITKPSVYEEIPKDTDKLGLPNTPTVGKPGHLLSELNCQISAFWHVATERFLQKKVAVLSRKAEIRKITERAPAGEESEPDYSLPVNEKLEPPVTKCTFDSYESQRKKDIKELLATKNLTNQEKLGAYAFLSRYRGSEMQALLKLCIENCLYANAVIEIFEHEDRYDSYESMKKLLLTLVSPSEYRMKQQLAEELILGKWYIVAKYRGKDTKFQLVPIDEFNEIRKQRDLPESAFTYPEIVPESLRNDKEISKRENNDKDTDTGKTEPDIEEKEVTEIPCYPITAEALVKSP